MLSCICILYYVLYFLLYVLLKTLGEASPIQGGSFEQFSKYILSFPEEELKSALHFNMTEFDRV